MRSKVKRNATPCQIQQWRSEIARYRQIIALKINAAFARDLRRMIQRRAKWIREAGGDL